MGTERTEGGEPLGWGCPQHIQKEKVLGVGMEWVILEAMRSLQCISSVTQRPWRIMSRKWTQSNFVFKRVTLLP